MLDRATYESWALNSGFGDDYAGTLMAANNLALSSLLNGDFRDALRRDRQTLKRRVDARTARRDTRGRLTRGPPSPVTLSRPAGTGKRRA